MKLSILVPVYNEEQTLEEVVRRVCAFQVPKEIILVDDGSKDRSRQILTRMQAEYDRAKDPLNQIKVIFQPHNQGKGCRAQIGVCLRLRRYRADPRRWISNMIPATIRPCWRRSNKAMPMSSTARASPAAERIECIFFGTPWVIVR